MTGGRAAARCRTRTARFHSKEAQMTEPMCARCRANPPAVAGLCLPCHVDRLAEVEATRRAAEQARVATSRRGRPAWRPSTDARNHGHGTESIR
jgi:hypothetical protein